VKKLGPDDLKMREFIYSLIDITSARSILDLGCGDGLDLIKIGGNERH